ncbi:Rieske 2Fe-2S domain-containing protein [Chitinophaga agrisoli]|uniref:Rieske 2Fe-2S domain-containing protein n=2 Tax=Chitinophaga agrisoli TaxID=2607653 RepID=A0A5B2VLH9_9BACT|nr:Rieske 2Fe-2S domain-containing protein [Chitinophaga agrisoli]
MGKVFDVYLTYQNIHIMKSTAHIKGHPLHPILVTFPIAFFTGTLLFDILAVAGNRSDLAFAAYCMQTAGIISAVLAAVPGVIDYFFTVPPQSSAKKRGAQHGLLNVLNLVLFTVSWLLKRDPYMPAIWILLMEAAGIVILSIAGWLGGTLVYRNQIGVDPRYARAGKWKEERISNAPDRVQVATTDELKTDQMKLVHVHNRRIVVAKTESGYVAFDDHCTHKGGSLAGGMMICGTVQCPWHGSQFDCTTGELKAGPANQGIVTYMLTEDNGKVYLNF